MLTRTRLKIAGATLCAVVLGGGHALTAHADAATDLANAAAANALEVAAQATTWSDTNTTCGPEVSGQGVFGGAGGNVNVFQAQEVASADVTCFSFTEKNYTLTATLSIMEYDAHARDPKNPFDITVCNQAGLPFNAVDGAATVRFPLMQCAHPLSATPAVRSHIARITWTTTITGYGLKTADSAPPWPMVY